VKTTYIEHIYVPIVDFRRTKTNLYICNGTSD